MTADVAAPRAAEAVALQAEPQAAALRSMRIALVSEGCYPFRPGGVSLWCHQLIQGMPENSFTAVTRRV